MINIDIDNVDFKTLLSIGHINDWITRIRDNNDEDFATFDLQTVDIYNGYGKKLDKITDLDLMEINKLAEKLDICLYNFDEWKKLLDDCAPDELEKFIQNNGYYFISQERTVEIECYTKSSNKSAQQPSSEPDLKLGIKLRKKSCW